MMARVVYSKYVMYVCEDDNDNYYDITKEKKKMNRNSIIAVNMQDVASDKSIKIDLIFSTHC